LEKRTSRRHGGVTSLGDALDGYLRESGLAQKLALRRIYSAWDAACGPRLAERARPVRFRDGQLLVEVQSSAHLHELESFTGEGLRRAANQRLGRAEILKVVFQLKR
jgi:predicted nucleic acid-binding Zn ribbon protein